MLVLPGLAAGAVAVLPLWYLLREALAEGWESLWAEVWSGSTAALLGRSLALVASVTAACAVLGVGAAVLVVRSDLPFRRVLSVVLAMPLAVPSFVAAFAWISWRPSLAGFWGAMLVLTTVSYPFVFLPVAASLRRLDPAQEEVARSLGRSPGRVLLSVALPQIRTPATAGALLVALYVLSDFGAVGTMRYEAFTWVIYGAFRAGFDPSRAAVLACILVLVALALVAGETFARGRGEQNRVGAGVARAQQQLALGRWKWPALGSVALLVGAGLAFPVVSVLVWFTRGVSAGIAWDEFGSALGSTVAVAVLGAVVTMALAVPLGILSARHRGAAVTALERSVYVAHGLPGIVVALSLVFVGVTVLRPLYQSTPMLTLAYAVLFLPLAVGSVRSSVLQSPVQLEEVGHSLGKGRWGVLFHVTLPLAAPGIGAGTALVMLAIVKELPATLLLHPTGMETLAMNLWSETTVGRYAAAAPAALALMLLSSVPTWILTRTTGGYR